MFFAALNSIRGLIVGEVVMRLLFFILSLVCLPHVGMAMVASTEYVATYVEHKTESAVDTSATANQTMAGTYTVSGTLIVPTPPLPSAQ